jgi:hypothetical protein
VKRAVARNPVRALVLGLVLALLGAGAAAPAEARRLSPGPFVDLGTAARLAPDGRRIALDLVASCPERWTVVKAVVTVTQPQASGEGSFPLTCIGSARPFTVVVQSTGAPFELGEASADALVLIQRGRTDQVQDSEAVHVDPTVFVDVASTAQLVGSGEAVSIDVTAACPKGATGQESYVNVSQGQSNGNGNYVPVCDGLPHTFAVTVRAARGLYQAGSARALSFGFVEAGGQSFAGIDDTAVEIMG